MGGSKEKSGGLGRALIRKHSQMVQQSKEKGLALRLQQRKVIESVTDISDIDAAVEQAEEAALLYSSENPGPILRIDLDRGVIRTEERKRLQKEEAALHANNLRVPRRPPWHSKMSAEELDVAEKQAFLSWRRSLASLEENENLVLTPFEKNLDIWRQLWRVLERSDLLVMVVDARDPLFYYCPDLELLRSMNAIVNLASGNEKLLAIGLNLKKWAEYFKANGILFIFWSAKAASAILEGKKLSNKWDDEQSADESSRSNPDTRIYGRDELLARLQAEAESVVSRKGTIQKETDGSFYSSESSAARSIAKQVVVGFVGYPNVGKSSTINALVGGKRTESSYSWKDEALQTIIISNELILCDCPGLVFPSFSSSRYHMIASGVLPVDRMTDPEKLCRLWPTACPENVLEEIYNIKLPKPKPYEQQSRPPTAAEVLRAYCSSRGHVSSSGLPDETRAARQILKDYVDGKIPHFELPSKTTTTSTDAKENNLMAMEEQNTSTDESDACELKSKILLPLAPGDQT
ncbi:hypothetical protein HPP92_017119 [Vanilla planifolia]|uniref:G domain-containing protein n=1 Tax=Vanilla planifolia TaxID=51239 RepID=A0A835QBM9_VANPL|nr:hypothetical protein HPP92_017119 [Vanilla planifolia]